MTQDDYSGRTKVDTAYADDSHMHSIFAPTLAPNSKARSGVGTSKSESHDGIRGKPHDSNHGGGIVGNDDIEGLDPEATVVVLDTGTQGWNKSDEAEDESISKPTGSWRDRVKKAKLQEEIAKDRRQQRLESGKAKLAASEITDSIQCESSSAASMHDAYSISTKSGRDTHAHCDEKVCHLQLMCHCVLLESY